MSEALREEVKHKLEQQKGLGEKLALEGQISGRGKHRAE